MSFESIPFAFPTHNRPIGAILTKRGDIMQQPPPRGRRSFLQWYRAQTRFARIGLGCASIFVVLMLCTFTLAAYGSTLPPPKTTQSPTSTPTKAPTQAIVLVTVPRRPP